MLDLSLCLVEVLNRNGATSNYIFLLVMSYCLLIYFKIKILNNSFDDILNLYTRF